MSVIFPEALWSLTSRCGNRRFGFQPDVSGQPRRHAGGDDLRERTLCALKAATSMTGSFC